MCSVRCKELIVEDAFHFHLFSVLLIVKIVVLLWRIIEIVVFSRGLTFYHTLQFVTLLYELFIEFLELISLSNQILQLLGHGVNIVLFLLAH